MLLGVFMVRPTKFYKYLEFCAKLICCLKIFGECKKFFFGNLGLKVLFWKSYHLILMHFVLKFQCSESILNFFQKIWVFLKIGEPLPISIDPFCFSIDRNFLNLIERASVSFDRSKLFFDRSNSFKIVLLKPLSVSIDWG